LETNHRFNVRRSRKSLEDPTSHDSLEWWSQPLWDDHRRQAEVSTRFSSGSKAMPAGDWLQWVGDKTRPDPPNSDRVSRDLQGDQRNTPSSTTRPSAFSAEIVQVHSELSWEKGSEISKSAEILSNFVGVFLRNHEADDGFW